MSNLVVTGASCAHRKSGACPKCYWTQYAKVKELTEYLEVAVTLHGEACEVKRWVKKLGFGPTPVCSCPTLATGEAEDG